jgi:hypothetical protein
VFADYDAKKFNLGIYARGKSQIKEFDKAGLVALFCEIHDEMSAFIMVVDTPYYAKANDSGAFSIPDVPPGKYVLNVWHENQEVLKQPVTITAGQASMNLRLKRQ